MTKEMLLKIYGMASYYKTDAEIGKERCPELAELYDERIKEANEVMTALTEEYNKARRKEVA